MSPQGSLYCTPILSPRELPFTEKKNCIDMIYHRLQPWLEASVWAQCQVRKSVRYNKRLVLHSMAQARRLP